MNSKRLEILPSLKGIFYATPRRATVIATVD